MEGAFAWTTNGRPRIDTCSRGIRVRIYLATIAACGVAVAVPWVQRGSPQAVKR
jgi:hypothetical protein